MLAARVFELERADGSGASPFAKELASAVVGRYLLPGEISTT
jgi:hypothetical protein